MLNQLTLLTEYFVALKSDRRGVTALEYGLIAALMATIIVALFTTFGANLTTAFTNIGKHLTTGK